MPQSRQGGEQPPWHLLAVLRLEQELIKESSGSHSADGAHLLVVLRLEQERVEEEDDELAQGEVVADEGGLGELRDLQLAQQRLRRVHQRGIRHRVPARRRKD